MVDLSRKRHVIKLLWFFLVSCTLLACTQSGFFQRNAFASENPLEAPSMVISETRFDFGEVDEGSVISHDFTVKNTGNTELQINKVSPD